MNERAPRRVEVRIVHHLGVTNEGVEELIRSCEREVALAIAEGNPPFGCVITDGRGRIVTRAHNTELTGHDPTGHAEMHALRQLAQTLGGRYLDGYIVFSNAASCSMCMSAAIKAGITRFYFGAPHEPEMDPWLPMTEVASRARRPIEIHGPILADECARQIAEGRMALRESADRAT